MEVGLRAASAERNFACGGRGMLIGNDGYDVDGEFLTDGDFLGLNGVFLVI